MSRAKSLYVEVLRDELEALRARVAELAQSCSDLRLKLAYEEGRKQPSTGVALPEWLRDDESLAERLRIAGWEAVHDAQWTGLEVLRCDIWQARLKPCRAQSVPDGYVMVPIGLAHILMAPNARPLTARDARNALREIVDAGAASAKKESGDE